MRRGKTSIAALTMAVLAAVAGTAFCAPARASSGENIGARIGYVDIGRALNHVSDGRAAKQQLKLEFREKQQRLDMLQKELAEMKDGLDRDRMSLSSKELESRDGAYRGKLMDVQRRFAEFQQNMAEREARLTGEILKRIRTIVADIGDREGYALILEKSQELVLYSPGASDITDRVIDEYNRGAKGKRGR
ncbi:MAG: OmpH family outer membrane protein [Proteobacteria bacterium]|nr:OmpH family outer membrane protein [Pseudomonadota bacterium]